MRVIESECAEREFQVGGPRDKIYDTSSTKLAVLLQVSRFNTMT